LVSAKTVADIVRATYVGVLGRVSKAQERSARDQQVVQDATQFLQALTKVLPELLTKSAAELRETSLTSSGTVLRLLAGVWHTVRASVSDTGDSAAPRMTYDDFVAFLKKLQPHMGAPIMQGNPWLITGYFPRS
jgi:hypothetical protein